MANQLSIQLPTFSLLDRALATFLSERSELHGEDKKQLQELLLRLSNQLSAGDSCITVDSEVCALIERSGLIAIAGRDPAPLVLEEEGGNGRLYLYRYWFYENRLAEQLKALVNRPLENIGEPSLERYFTGEEGVGWQRKAALCALTNSFTIITGGPGTGKTTTVVKIVAMLLEQAMIQGKPLNIALAAPTGKAAMRLQQSITGSRELLPCDGHIREQIPVKVVTVHRLFGPRRFSPYFHHRAKNPLPYDLVIVDEASMVDLALMCKLVDALKPHSKLILLGDKNQLASVESGAVLADLIEALPDKSVELKQSFRFDANIKALSEGVNEQRAEELWQALNNGSYDNVSLLSKGDYVQDVRYAAGAGMRRSGYVQDAAGSGVRTTARTQEVEQCMKQLSRSSVARVVEQSQPYWNLIRDRAPFDKIIAAFGQFQCLATNRVGSLGVINTNERVEGMLADRALIERGDIGGWYQGRPIIVTQNIPELGLFNGDIGITLADPEGGLRVYFEGDEKVRDFIPSRISHCETAWVMTIHKSQGSEFDEVLILFPEVMNPVLTKELLYTAITRAKRGVELVVTKDIWIASVRQKIERHSGLVKKLSQ
ncbi:MAG: exodeoxyribonuclease V subunit alpha [Gammaproteobacteria bacterium]|nr:exodeoxyribonuclease V subunit alpha [Gammaproteobacteria bacterium]